MSVEDIPRFSIISLTVFLSPLPVLFIVSREKRTVERRNDNQTWWALHTRKIRQRRRSVQDRPQFGISISLFFCRCFRFCLSSPEKKNCGTKKRIANLMNLHNGRRPKKDKVSQSRTHTNTVQHNNLSHCFLVPFFGFVLSSSPEKKGNVEGRNEKKIWWTSHLVVVRAKDRQNKQQTPETKIGILRTASKHTTVIPQRKHGE